MLGFVVNASTQLQESVSECQVRSAREQEAQGRGLLEDPRAEGRVGSRDVGRGISVIGIITCLPYAMVPRPGQATSVLYCVGKDTSTTCMDVASMKLSGIGFVGIAHSSAPEWNRTA